MAGNAAQGSHLDDGPMIHSVTTVADIQDVLHRMLHRIKCIETEMISNASGAEQQLVELPLPFDGASAMFDAHVLAQQLVQLHGCEAPSD